MSSTLLAALATGAPAIAMMLALKPILAAMGASGETLEHAAQFLTIVLPSMPLMRRM